MTLNELAYNVLNKLRGGRSSNNEYISLDQIKFNINYYRSLLLHRDLRKSQNKHLFEQTINVQVESDTMFDFKLQQSIPSIIQLDHEYPLSVRLENKTFPVENYHRAMFNEFNSFTNGRTRFFIKRNDMFIYGTNDLENNDEIEVTGIFENPTQTYLFNGEDPITVDDLRYPISGDLAQRISQSLINGDMEIILRTSNDITADNLPPNPKGQ